MIGRHIHTCCQKERRFRNIMNRGCDLKGGAQNYSKETRRRIWSRRLPLPSWWRDVRRTTSDVVCSAKAVVSRMAYRNFPLRGALSPWLRREDFPFSARPPCSACVSSTSYFCFIIIIPLPPIFIYFLVLSFHFRRIYCLPLLLISSWIPLTRHAYALNVLWVYF
jgi:hypothetical protein